MRDAGAVIHSHGIESCLATMINPSSKEFRVSFHLMASIHKDECSMCPILQFLSAHIFVLLHPVHVSFFSSSDYTFDLGEGYIAELPSV